MKKIALVLVLVLLAQVIFAEDAEISSSTLSFVASTRPEAKLTFTQSFTIPFLQADNPLMSGNNIRFDLSAEVTPISLNGIMQTVWSPLALLEFSTGGRVGSGWYFEALGAIGNGFNVPVMRLNDGTTFIEAEYEGNPLDAILWKAWIGGTFQFSLAAIIRNNDWTHVVMQTYHELNYHGNTRARAGQSWYYENDDGENRNGFNYYGNFLLGYQMPRKPLFLSMVALLAEMDKYLYVYDNTPNRHVWGDNLIRWHFGGILRFSFTEKIELTLITQLRTRRNFTNFDERGDGPVMHYQSRILDTSDPQRLEFYRVAAAVSYKF